MDGNGMQIGMGVKCGLECNADWSGDEMWMGKQCSLQCG